MNTKRFYGGFKLKTNCAVHCQNVTNCQIQSKQKTHLDVVVHLFLTCLAYIVTSTQMFEEVTIEFGFVVAVRTEKLRFLFALVLDMSMERYRVLVSFPALRASMVLNWKNDRKYSASGAGDVSWSRA